MQKHEDLKAARLLAGLKQGEAASIAGVSQKQFSFWETGRVSPPAGRYEAFLLAIGKTQSDVDAWWAAQVEKPKPAPLQSAADAYIFSLPYDKAQAYCAEVILRHPEPPKPKAHVYDAQGYDEEGYNRKGFDQDGFDRDGYNGMGRDKHGYGKPEGVNKLRYSLDGYPHPFACESLDDAREAVRKHHEPGNAFAIERRDNDAASAKAEEAYWTKLIKLEGKDFVAREYARLLCWVDLNFDSPEEEAAYWSKVKADKVAKNEDLYILHLQVKHKLPGFVEAQKRLDKLDEDLC